MRRAFGATPSKPTIQPPSTNPLSTSQGGSSPRQNDELPPQVGTVAQTNPASRVLTNTDFAVAARALDCSVAAVRAVAYVESATSGFLSDGRPTILFEAHIFDRLTKGRYRGFTDTRGIPISTQNWTRKNYGESGAFQYTRLRVAASYDFNAAHESTSWGAFQLMGMNWKALGYADVPQFLGCMESAAGQLDGFVRFVRLNNLASALQTLDWKQFALKYNGPGYAQNAYDVKMAAAYARFRDA